MAFLLAILQPATLMVLQHSVLAAEVSGAEAAITDNALGSILAVFKCAAHLLGGHATSDRRCEFEGRVRKDVQRDQGRVCGGGCEMTACVEEAQIRRWKRRSKREELAKGGDRGCWWKSKRDNYEQSKRADL